MNAIFLVNSDSFNEIKTLIKLVEDGASNLLNTLYQTPPTNEYSLPARKYYEKLLLRALENAQLLRAQWDVIKAHPHEYVVDMHEYRQELDMIKNGVLQIQATIDSIESIGLFVSSEGVLFQTSNCARS
jgi:hypothetical protein